MSRVFQSIGTGLDDLPALWVAAPLTGLLVQPVVGHLSDRTWLGRLGRRRPYFLLGAILAAVALFAMPEARVLWAAAALLWLLDASLNISMEPFRAFVGDMLRRDQHAAGYAVQTAFIGAGAVVGSIFPWVLEQLGVSNEAAPGAVPDTVRIAFWAGGAALFAAVLWTVVTTREHPPAAMARFAGGGGEAGDAATLRALAVRPYRGSVVWGVAGVAVVVLVRAAGLRQEMYLLGGLLLAYGAASALAIRGARAGAAPSMLDHIVGDFAGMPALMKRLALVQFFSWSALFIMWINTTPVVTGTFFAAPDAAAPGYQAGANWVDVLFATYNGIAAVAALTLLPLAARRFGRVRTHAAALVLGAAGFAAFFVAPDHRWLLAGEVGIGIAWASILAMPYAILASALPQAKLGVYMGLFNVFVVVPQLLVATVMGSVQRAFFPDAPIWTMAFAAGTLLLAAVATVRVPEPPAG